MILMDGLLSQLSTCFLR